MKKFFMMAVMAVAALSANAQYAPAKGDFSTVIKFNPFSNNSTTFDNVDKYAIQGRYMVSDNDGIRLTLGLGSESTNSEAKYNDTKLDLTNSATTFSIKAGYERHFSANGRIDLYAGAQVGFATTSTKDESLGMYMGQSEMVPFVAYEKGGANTLSIGAFTGINFYVYKKLFVGAEIGFNYAHGTMKDKEQFKTNKNGDGTTTETVDMPGSTNSLGFKVEPALTLGWTF